MCIVPGFGWWFQGDGGGGGGGVLSHPNPNVSFYFLSKYRTSASFNRDSILWFCHYFFCSRRISKQLYSRRRVVTCDLARKGSYVLVFKLIFLSFLSECKYSTFLCCMMELLLTVWKQFNNNNNILILLEVKIVSVTCMTIHNMAFWNVSLKHYCWAKNFSCQRKGNLFHLRNVWY